MAERRDERATFDRQMQALKIEMTENLERYETTLEKIEDQFDSLSRLRALLVDPSLEACLLYTSPSPRD